jgi:hypothetical protein
MIDQDIQRRMDAYRGNPQALMQRYQQNQQLIDLLALQKLKSEKEAAARSLQMASAQGQGEPPTVAQQREQEVMGLTQQEVARSVGAEAQQRAAREQEAMQRLLQGIAGAPGAENAMPERAMAAGGIVAFQSGGNVTYKGRSWEDLEPEFSGGAERSFSNLFSRRDKRINPDTGKPITFAEFMSLAEQEKMVPAKPAPVPAGGMPVISGREPLAPIITAAPADYLGEPSVEELAVMAPARAAPPPARTCTRPHYSSRPRPKVLLRHYPNCKDPEPPGCRTRLSRRCLEG